ncbi:unnamed protein product [Rhizophagus irregularis]|uniref:Uncharacterized protein n=1 Tax=Rhizophagus irregularis TaxID=588596 RepID=A0A916E431_9GLOM|nr:unnamed protein product [Rhizophagus irregularis]CAB5211661.1 unnamed protein product [Rhizophagus irregularis]CAB5358081.1 unnamed protein product [Rhizophagus irregularis]
MSQSRYNHNPVAALMWRSMTSEKFLPKLFIAGNVPDVSVQHSKPRVQHPEETRRWRNVRNVFLNEDFQHHQHNRTLQPYYNAISVKCFVNS